MELLKKVASRKLGVEVGGGAALTVASPEALWPTALVAAALNIAGQTVVDTWGE